MTNAFEVFNHFSPLLLLPYLALVLSVFAYFAYQKYKVRIQIKNIPFSTILFTDLEKVKKNLRITSMVYNFILVLVSLEILTNIFLAMGQFEDCDLKLYSKSIVGTSCESVRNQTYVIKIVDFNQFDSLISNCIFTFLSMISPVSGLFLIVLRRVFINLPYHHWVRGYTIYILSRLTTMSILSLFPQTFVIFRFIIFPFAILDFCVYISASRSFYILLKGRRDEALHHSSRGDYFEKKRIARQYFCSQILTTFAITLFVLIALMVFLQSSIRISYEPDLLHFISFGFAPALPLPSSKITNEINKVCNLLAGLGFLLMDIYLFVIYIFVCLVFFVKLLIKRNKFNHVNAHITRPQMENYRANLERRRNHERPPFIQAFRSRLVY